MATSPTTQLEILRELRQSKGDFVSGAELADRLGISRMGVWKHIQKLKAMGYEISSHPKGGYRLEEVPDSLAHGEIVPNLQTKWLGIPYHYLQTVSSTNDHALLLAAQNAPHGTVVVAETQTRGRGRLRREWISTPNRGIHVSILFRSPLPVRVAPQSTQIGALALVKVLRETFGLSSQIKWPNDVLVNHKKVAGILTEMQSDQDFSRFIVMGIGINVNHTAEDLAGPFRYPATSIAIETGLPVKRQHLLIQYLRQFEQDYELFLHQGLSALIPQLEEFSEILGKTVSVTYGDREITGRAEGFTPEGALLLLQSNGQQETIWVGDVARVESAP
ncbi:MAG: biotin--[acetyl-CoA-carboxylase] ligase [Desulfobacteraceae bacterium]|nr:biotin--[acetyl-CoA-carboxylase] ligase [Desulfobacteraceae bacterium]